MQVLETTEVACGSILILLELSSFLRCPEWHSILVYTCSYISLFNHQTFSMWKIVLHQETDLKHLADPELLNSISKIMRLICKTSPTS